MQLIRVLLHVQRLEYFRFCSPGQISVFNLELEILHLILNILKVLVRYDVSLFTFFPNKGFAVDFKNVEKIQPGFQFPDAIIMILINKICFLIANIFFTVIQLCVIEFSNFIDTPLCALSTVQYTLGQTARCNTVVVVVVVLHPVWRQLRSFETESWARHCRYGGHQFVGGGPG